MSRGHLRIYVGAAPGVGKTYAMLNEGRRRAGRGTDVVVACAEPHGRAATAAQQVGLEAVPRRALPLGDGVVEEMDVDAVIARSPAVALVDELAHTNAPGCRNEKRWQDVDELLAAGIDVITTLNIQDLESLNDVVEGITGVRQPDTVPDDVVRAAEQVELVDMTPEAIRRRLAHGNICAPDEIDAALANYFRPGNLGALRELALLWVADRVDEALLRYRDDHDIARPWETRERVVVALTGAPTGEQLIRRAARVAARSRGDLLGVHIREGGGNPASPTNLLERHRQLLTDLGGEYHELVADDVVPALVDFARDQNATQLVLGASQRTRWAELTRGSVINRVLRHSGDIDVHVISTRGADDGDVGAGRAPSALTPLPTRRRQVGWLVATGGTAALTAVLASGRGTFGQGSQFLLYEALVLVAAMVGGAAPAVTAAVLASVALNWYFTPPLHTWSIDDGENVLALVVFVVVGVLVGLLVTTLAQRSADARRGRAEAEALARVAAGIVGVEDPLPAMLERIRSTLDLEGVSVYGAVGEPPIGVAGEPPDGGPGRTIGLAHGALRIRGQVRRDDERILDAFAAQVEATLERRALQVEAARADALAAADRLRTAILRAVSHDLRTPLASIKASVTSLLQDDVEWSADAQREFLSTIDEEADRLDDVIGNLLDASRLEAGAIEPSSTLIALDEVVPTALATISGLRSPVEVDISPELPLVVADPGLLERAIANLVANADEVTPAASSIRIAASHHGSEVQLRIVDQGPGVPAGERERMFRPFQRLGDASSGSGVGLGLTVAKGIIEAMGGALGTEDTPGGGLTMVISLEAAADA